MDANLATSAYLLSSKNNDFLTEYLHLLKAIRIVGRFAHVRGSRATPRHYSSLSCIEGRRSPTSGAIECEVCDVYIAERRQKEGMVNSDPIRKYSLQLGDDRAADDCCHQDSRACLGKWAESVDRQGEDTWEHYRIKKTNRKDAPNSDRAQTEHRSADQ